MTDLLSATLRYLRPNGGYVISQEDVENGIYDEGCEPILQTEFIAAKKIVEKKLQEEEQARLIAKSELLAKLGITEEEAKLLLS